MSDQTTPNLRSTIVEIVAPLLADGRTAGSDGVPRVGRATKKKAEQIADALIERIRKDWMWIA